MKHPGLLLVLVALAILAAGCATSSSPTPTKDFATPPAGPSAAAGPGGRTEPQSPPARAPSAAGAQVLPGDVRPTRQVDVVATISGQIREIQVDVGDAVRIGQVMAVLDHSSLDAQLQQAEGALKVVEARLASLEAGPREENVQVAKANLATAKAQLSLLQAGATASQRKIAELTVEQAKHTLAGLKFSRDSACRPFPNEPVYRCIQQEQVEAAEVAVQVATEQLLALIAGPRPQELERAQSAVDLAEAQLRLARAPVTAYDLEAARAQVAQAKAALELVRIQREAAWVRAPFDGIVAKRFVSVGTFVTSTTPLLTLVSGDVRVTVTVAEASLTTIAAGDLVSIESAAFPQKRFQGKVSAVAPTADLRTRAFEVTITPQDPEGQLKPGMFVKVTHTPRPREQAR